MATTRMTLVNGWHADNTITASGETAVYFTNNTGRTLYYAVTASGLPAFSFALGHYVHIGGQASITLADTEVLCLAIEGADADITVTTGAA